jgi:hypothetical protein
VLHGGGQLRACAGAHGVPVRGVLAGSSQSGISDRGGRRCQWRGRTTAQDRDLLPGRGVLGRHLDDRDGEHDGQQHDRGVGGRQPAAQAQMPR